MRISVIVCRLMTNDILISSIKKNSYDISAWFEKHQKRIPIPFLTSITIRDGGFKIGSPESHLFPVGVNNLCKKDLGQAPQLIKKFFKRYHADVGKIKYVIVLATVENPNPFYYEHLLTLESLLKRSGIKPVLATLENIAQPVTIKTPSKKSIKIVKAFIKGRKLQTADGIADFIYVSYPFSLDVKRQLSDLTQTINPPIKVLARTEKRSEYLFLFNQLDNLSKEQCNPCAPFHGILFETEVVGFG